jgi:hypothetical protein
VDKGMGALAALPPGHKQTRVTKPENAFIRLNMQEKISCTGFDIPLSRILWTKA